MTQIFRPWSGFFIVLGLLGLVVLTVALILVARAATARVHHIDEPIAQPVPFSHEHHVGQIGLDCRYCHQSVETAAFAGIPPISTCMTCHSQLFTDEAMLAPVVNSWQSGVAQFHWNRIHDVPGFVYFNHSVHIANGVGCVSCHGRVDKMPLTMRTQSLNMQWCLDCHRDPAPHLRPRDRVFDMGWQATDRRLPGEHLMRKYQIDPQRMTECVLCHR